MNLGDPVEIIEVEQPAIIPDTVPVEAPVEPEKVEVPA